MGDLFVFVCVVKKMKKHLLYTVCVILFLSSCRGTDTVHTVSPSLPTSLEPVLPLTEVEATPNPTVVDTVAPIAATTLTIELSPTIEPVPTSTSTQTLSLPDGLPMINEQPGDPYTTVFSIPVGGDDTIQYRGVDNPDIEITGPNAIAVLPDDTFVIGDLIGNRLLYYGRDGNLLNTVELFDLGITNVADLRVYDSRLFLLEISLDFWPSRYRVNQLSFDGKLITSDDIPERFGIDHGLTGIAIDCDGKIVLEMAGGSDMYRLEDIQNSSDIANVPNGYNCNGKLYRVVNSGPQKPPMLMAGDVTYETQLTAGFGGLSLLKVFEDGSFYVLRDDVVDDPVVKVDQTVHYIGADMTSQGSARVPLSEAYYYIMRNIVANTKGEVFVLLPRRDSLDVVQLNFYQSLEPLSPSSIVPQITVSANHP